MSNQRRALAQRVTREAALPLLITFLLGAGAIGLSGCQDEGDVNEAVEELKDEAGDAKDELKDEVDDHS